MNNIGNIIGFIGSICSIVGFPIALIQIWKIKSTTKSMKDSIYNFLSLEKIFTLNKIFDTVTTQRNSLVIIQNKITKKGVSIENINTDCEVIIKEVNTCIYNLPSEFNDIEKQLCNSIKSLELYLQNHKSEMIYDACDYLYMAINSLKKVKEGNREVEIATIAK